MADAGQVSPPLGYITGMKINFTNDEDKCFKNLPNNFEWEGIPMLAVITGINGCGKSNLFKAISQGVVNRNNNLNNGCGVHLTLRKGIKELQFFHFSSENINKTTTEKISAASQNNKRFKEFSQYLLLPSSIDSSSNHENKEIFIKVIENLKGIFKSSTKCNFDDFEQALKQELEKLSKYQDISNYASFDRLQQNLLRDCNGNFKGLENHLKNHGFKYAICFDKNKREISFERNEVIKYEKLSPGERLELLTLFWLFDAEYSIDDKCGGVLLLDEPDVHLHPSLAKNMIETINDRLVNQLKIQVILTTHNPTTATFVPEECLYIMSENADHTVTIQKSDVKRNAIQLLTSNFLQINEPFRIVFVEARDDIPFYDLVYNELLMKRLISSKFRIVFTDVIIESSSNSDCARARVKRIVEKLNNNGDSDSLADFIFGLIGNNDSDHQNIITFNRYSIENYIYDPVLIYYYLKDIHCSYPGLPISLPVPDLPDSLPDLLNLLDNNPEDLKKKVEKIISLFETTVNNYIKDMNDQTIERISDVTLKEATTWILDKKNGIVGDDNKLTKEEITFEGNVTLYYPKMLIKMEKPYLTKFLKEIFGDSLMKKKKWMRSLHNIKAKTGKKLLLIPKDIIDTFKLLTNGRDVSESRSWPQE